MTPMYNKKKKRVRKYCSNTETIQTGYYSCRKHQSNSSRLPKQRRGLKKKSGVKVEEQEEDKEERGAEGERYESIMWSQTIHSPVGGREWQNGNSH